MADLMEIEPIDLMEIDIKPSNSNKQNSHE